MSSDSDSLFHAPFMTALRLLDSLVLRYKNCAPKARFPHTQSPSPNPFGDNLQILRGLENVQQANGVWSWWVPNIGRWSRSDSLPRRSSPITSMISSSVSPIPTIKDDLTKALRIKFTKRAQNFQRTIMQSLRTDIGRQAPDSFDIMTDHLRRGIA